MADGKFSPLRETTTEKLDRETRDLLLGMGANKAGAEFASGIPSLLTGILPGIGNAMSAEEWNKGWTHTEPGTLGNFAENALNAVGTYVPMAGKPIAALGKAGLKEVLKHGTSKEIQQALKMHELKLTGDQLGSNPGGVYTHPTTGAKYYIKQGQTPEHASSENLAANLYELAGANTLDYVPVEGGGHIATKWANLDKSHLNKLSPEERIQAKKDFATHAWLANWDAVGLGGDNIGTLAGKPVWQDLGGALEFRAKGDPKGEKFGTTVGELQTLRDKGLNEKSADLFGDMSDADIWHSIRQVADIPDDAIRDRVAHSGRDEAYAQKLIDRKHDLIRQGDELRIKAMNEGRLEEFDSGPSWKPKAAPESYLPEETLIAAQKEFLKHDDKQMAAQIVKDKFGLSDDEVGSLYGWQQPPTTRQLMTADATDQALKPWSTVPPGTTVEWFDFLEKNWDNLSVEAKKNYHDMAEKGVLASGPGTIPAPGYVEGKHYVPPKVAQAKASDEYFNTQAQTPDAHPWDAVDEKQLADADATWKLQHPPDVASLEDEMTAMLKHDPYKQTPFFTGNDKIDAMLEPIWDTLHENDKTFFKGVDVYNSDDLAFAFSEAKALSEGKAPTAKASDLVGSEGIPPVNAGMTDAEGLNKLLAPMWNAIGEHTQNYFKSADIGDPETLKNLYSYAKKLSELPSYANYFPAKTTTKMTDAEIKQQMKDLAAGFSSEKTGYGMPTNTLEHQMAKLAPHMTPEKHKETIDYIKSLSNPAMQHDYANAMLNNYITYKPAHKQPTGVPEVDTIVADYWNSFNDTQKSSISAVAQWENKADAAQYAQDVLNSLKKKTLGSKTTQWAPSSPYVSLGSGDQFDWQGARERAGGLIKPWDFASEKTPAKWARLESVPDLRPGERTVEDLIARWKEPGGLPNSMLTPEQLKAEGVNLDFPIFKTGDKMHYPVRFTDPVEHKQWEFAAFGGDDPRISRKFGDMKGRGWMGPTFPFLLRDTGNFGQINWKDFAGKTGYDPDFMGPLTHAADKAGIDVLKVNRITDYGEPQNQYLMFLRNAIRTPLSKFNPKDWESEDIMKGLALGGVGLGGAAALAPGEAKAEPDEKKSPDSVARKKDTPMDPTLDLQTPFGTKIKVPTQSTLPAGLDPQSASVFAPVIQQLQQAGLPVNITSGYRSPAQNAKVGGARDSQHLEGKALDLALAGMTPQQKQQAVSIVQGTGGIGGFGYYPKSDSIHIDTRPGKAAWGSNYSNTSVGRGWPDWMTQSTQKWAGLPPVPATVMAANAPAPVIPPYQPPIVQAMLSQAPTGPQFTPRPPAEPNFTPIPLPTGAAAAVPPAQMTPIPAPIPALANQAQATLWANNTPTKQPDMFGGIANALGGFAKAFSPPPTPQFGPDPTADAGARMTPQLTSLFEMLQANPQALNKMLDPKGMLLGLA